MVYRPELLILILCLSDCNMLQLVWGWNERTESIFINLHTFSRLPTESVTPVDAFFFWLHPLAKLPCLINLALTVQTSRHNGNGLLYHIKWYIYIKSCTHFWSLKYWQPWIQLKFTGEPGMVDSPLTVCGLSKGGSVGESNSAASLVCSPAVVHRTSQADQLTLGQRNSLLHLPRAMAHGLGQKSTQEERREKLEVILFLLSFKYKSLFMSWI